MQARPLRRAWAVLLLACSGGIEAPDGDGFIDDDEAPAGPPPGGRRPRG